MATNDAILVDAIIDDRIGRVPPSQDRAEVFEFFALEQILKDFDLSPDELESGWVDGADDGGIDGFFIFVNGHLVRDLATQVWPRKSATLEVYVITCKLHDTFEQAPINSLLASIPELFDFRIDSSHFTGVYSPAVRRVRDSFYHGFRRLATVLDQVIIRFAYISRGDTTRVSTNVRARGDQLLAAVRSNFSSSRVTFDFLGAADLVELHRRTKRFSLDLPFVEHLSCENSGYVVLAHLTDYCRFVTDENGALRRYLFDSNVRDYLGDTRVNEDMTLSLADAQAPDFWWLNNGITILATDARVVGKAIQLQDIQIVNGLQTTETIFRHFQTIQRLDEKRSVLEAIRKVVLS